MRRSRFLTGLALALAAFLLLSAPAHAGATRFEILASGAQTANGNGGGISVSGIREMIVFLGCTASSGTGEMLDIFLQSSSDGGTTWYDLPFEFAVTSDADGTETAPTINGRDIQSLAADVVCAAPGPGNAVAIYRVFGDLVRARWFIAGTTPSYTISVKAIGKN